MPTLLLANMLIFHTVVYQTKGINKLRAEGMDITNEILSGFAPYWKDHINRFGAFQLEMEKMMEKIEYDLHDIPDFKSKSMVNGRENKEIKLVEYSK